MAIRRRHQYNTRVVRRLAINMTLEQQQQHSSTAAQQHSSTAAQQHNVDARIKTVLE